MRYVRDLRLVRQSVEVGCCKCAGNLQRCVANKMKKFSDNCPQLSFPGNTVCNSKSQIYHRLCRSLTSAKLQHLKLCQNYVHVLSIYKYTPILQERYSTLLEAPAMTMPRYRYTITSIFINVIF